MSSRRESGRVHHENLAKQIPSCFPNLRPKQHEYIQNKISQIARTCKCEVVMWISAKPFTPCDAELHRSFKVGKTTVYLSILVD